MAKPEKAVWSTKFINTFPDSSFAIVLPGGKKDKEGKTVPRSLRKLPFKDDKGKVDGPHLRNALARLPQSDLTDAQKKKIKTKLQAELKRFNEEQERKKKVKKENNPFVGMFDDCK